MIGMAKGMLTTLRLMLDGAVTVQYPKVKRVLPERSRTSFDAAARRGRHAAVQGVHAVREVVPEQRDHHGDREARRRARAAC